MTQYINKFALVAVKELSIEEKAKRYNEALERYKAKQEYESQKVHEFIEYLFPELKESEDEVVWLKKFIQEEIDYLSIDVRDNEDRIKLQNLRRSLAWIEKQGENANFFNKIQIGDKVTRNRDGVLVNLSQLNRVAKPAEKQGKNNMGISEATKQKLENNLNKALEKETPESWNEFLEKQGEQKPIYSEEQHEKESLSDIENRIINFAMQFHDNRMKPEAEWEDELKMLRDNIKIDHWSEEDEVKINRIVACLENLNVADNDILLKDVEWLKSLRPQNTWKPSDEQIEALDDAIAICSERDYETECRLDNLRQDLKKLKQ